LGELSVSFPGPDDPSMERFEDYTRVKHVTAKID
jgi:hypothetical protein